MNKIIEAFLQSGKICQTGSVRQWDVGDKIHPNGITLPPSYKAKFSNISIRGTAKPIVLTGDTVEIPARA